MNNLMKSCHILLQRPMTDALLLYGSNTVLLSQMGQWSLQRALIKLFTYIPIYVPLKSLRRKC